MKLQRKPLALLLLIGFGHALAATPAPELPPDEIVARVLRGNPGVQAAASQIRVEEANRSRLEARCACPAKARSTPNSALAAFHSLNCSSPALAGRTRRCWPPRRTFHS